MKTRPAVAIALALISALGGCAGPSAYSTGRSLGATLHEDWRGPAIEPGYEQVAYRRARTAAGVFDTPGVQRELAGIDPSYLPEYARRDAGLSVSNPGPILASSQWPERQAPTLYDYRYVYLPSNPSTQLFFDAASGPGAYPSYPPYPGHYRHGGHGGYYGRP